MRSPDPAPRRGRRRLPGPERRALILSAALRTFAAHGYDGAAMDEIAAAAGISKAVVYDHVASKRDLYVMLLEAIRTEIERTVEDALSAPGGGEERVRAAVDAIYGYVEAHPEASRLLVLELQGANVSPIGRELEEKLSTGLARTLHSETPAFGGHADRELQLKIFAELLKSVVLGGAGWWCRHPKVPRRDLVDRTVDVLWPVIARALAPA
ncbi:MAG: TetR/AcrR family transcriptional regulator [Actinobacteria bacterium]|nr:TetR/AcrR family transcriptional regulator [Actinomycetota bacterium]